MEKHNNLAKRKFKYLILLKIVSTNMTTTSEETNVTNTRTWAGANVSRPMDSLSEWF